MRGGAWRAPGGLLATRQPGPPCAFVSLATTGHSLEKSALRMGGTLLAIVVGLFYLGLLPQDRWLFFAAFTPWLAFVSYKMTGRDGQYFWFVAAFVSLMITTAGPGSSEHAFNFAVTRDLETQRSRYPTWDG